MFHNLGYVRKLTVSLRDYRLNSVDMNAINCKYFRFHLLWWFGLVQCYLCQALNRNFQEHIICKTCGEVWCNVNDLFSITSELSLHQRNISFQVPINVETDTLGSSNVPSAEIDIDESQTERHSHAHYSLRNKTVLVQLFVNPAGVSFELLTTRVVNTQAGVHGSPIATDSWFPGYSWQPLSCKCGHHIGWRFTVNKDISVTTDNKESLSFYGLVFSKLLSDRDSAIFSASTSDSKAIHF